MNDFDIAVYQQVNLHNRQETSFGPAEIEVSARCLKNVSVRATARTDISVHQFGTGTCYSKHLNYAILFGDQEEMQRRRQLRERTEYIVSRVFFSTKSSRKESPPPQTAKSASFQRDSTT